MNGPSTREAQLEAEVAHLTTALGEAAAEICVWKSPAAGGALSLLRASGSFEDLEVIRRDEGMSPTRFCSLIGVPERT